MSIAEKSQEESAAVFPNMSELGDDLVPAPPRELNDTGIDRDVFAGLALKTAHASPQCTTKSVATRMHLPASQVESLLQELARDHFLDVLGSDGLLAHRYGITARGREQANHLTSISGYVGPAPVSLEAYTAMIHFHHARLPDVTLEDVARVLAELVLPPEDVMAAALAVTSRRSLFLFGPSGNGKTSLARLLHNVGGGEIWVPHAISIGDDIIAIFDPQVHHEVAVTTAQPWKIDQRWVRIQRPLIVAGGEMTVESLEIGYRPSRGLYEAPLHVKSNCGTFVIDDLGRQRVQPEALLNRWIIPLEHGFDYFALQSGPKITVPFQQMLIVATNLDPDKVMDPAFLRRMGYRLHMTSPDQARYREIFAAYAARWHADVPAGLLDRLLKRYREEGRDLKGCEPRDLIGRAQDVCQLLRQPMELNDEVLDLAWASYFGTKRTT